MIIVGPTEWWPPAARSLEGGEETEEETGEGCCPLGKRIILTNIAFGVDIFFEDIMLFLFDWTVCILTDKLYLFKWLFKTMRHATSAEL